MASSAQDSYGQPTVPLPLSTVAAAAAITDTYYDEHNQISGRQAPASIKSAASIEVDHPGRHHQRHNQHHQTSIEYAHRAAQFSSSSLGNYDSYISGMSSDSELTTSSASARHHHRPYSSQSRVYHAHPLPKNPRTPSTGSQHFSSSSAVSNVQQGSSYSNRQHRQQQQQQQQPLFMNNQSSNLPSQLAMSSQKPGTGRQLPQRPFKQSISIDHHSPETQLRNSGQITQHQHSPAHQQVSQSVAQGVHRNLADHLGGAYQQKSYPVATSSHHHFESTSSLFNDPASQRNIRFDMNFIEKQAANMSLYDASNERSLADLPPTGQLRSSSAASRHMPSTSQALMVDQHRQFQQQQLQPQAHQQHPIDMHHHHSQDSYVSENRVKAPSSSSSGWIPPMSGGSSGSNQAIGLARSHPSQFKQTMSIDHYSGTRQQQQRQYSPVRQNQFASTEQYHSFGPYSAGPFSSQPGAIIGGYDPSATINTAQAQDCYVGPSSAMGPDQEQLSMLKYHHYQSQALPMTAMSQHQQAGLSLERPKLTGSYEKSDSTSGGVSKSHNQQYPPSVGRSNLQHQQSSSSSNSNLSGSLNINNLENIANIENRPSVSNSEYQKSVSSASSHYQQSPQHKMQPGSRHQTGTRQDLLRRGYNSANAPIAVYDFGGSQSALSESGDISTSQVSHIGPGPSKRSGLRAASPSVALETSSSTGLSHHHGQGQYQAHHSTSSGQGLRESAGIRSESSTGLPNGSGSSSSLAKKSNSATQLSMTGTKKRLGFRKKQVTSFSVHRSEEVAPLEARHLVKQGSSVSEGDSSMSGDSSSRSWSNSNFKQHTSEELASMSFIDGLGKGQMISRQGLASPYLGDIQLSLCDRRGNLEVEIIRARNLQAKTNKIQPLTYVKLYLVKNRKCLAKAKTTLSNKRTLNPLFQQQLTFHEDYHGCILQSIVWGNFGKIDKKNFMGIAQISIDDLELSDTVISWYKLFLPSSLQTLPSKSLRHTLLSNSTESFTNTQNS